MVDQDRGEIESPSEEELGAFGILPRGLEGVDRTLQLYTVDPQIRATGRDDINRPLRDRYAEAVGEDLACRFTVFARLQAKFSAREIHLVMREEGQERYGIAFLLRTTSSMAVGVVEGQAFMIEGMTPVASLMGLPTFSLSGQATMVL